MYGALETPIPRRHGNIITVRTDMRMTAELNRYPPAVHRLDCKLDPGADLPVKGNLNRSHIATIGSQFTLGRGYIC